MQDDKVWAANKPARREVKAGGLVEVRPTSTTGPRKWLMVTSNLNGTK
jgi:hypothetical protein